MGLYASLMTLLLSFFILLNTLTENQEAGYKEGIGKVRNAFGFRGGFGLLNYMQMVRGRSKVRVKDEAKAGELTGTPKDLTIGKGGSGNVDQDTDTYRMDKYVQVRLNHDFSRKSARIPESLAEYLDNLGTTVQLFDYSMSIRCISKESNDEEEDRKLAAKRAAAIMLYLHRRNSIPLTRLRATGYTSTTYFVEEPKKLELPDSKQATFLCIYRSPKPQN